MKWRQFHNINDLITSMPNNREANVARTDNWLSPEPFEKGVCLG